MTTTPSWRRRKAGATAIGVASWPAAIPSGPPQAEGGDAPPVGEQAARLDDKARVIRFRSTSRSIPRPSREQEAGSQARCSPWGRGALASILVMLRGREPAEDTNPRVRIGDGRILLWVSNP